MDATQRLPQWTPPAMVEAYAADEGRTMDANASSSGPSRLASCNRSRSQDLDRHHCPTPSLTRWLDGTTTLWHRRPSGLV